MCFENGESILRAVDGRTQDITLLTIVFLNREDLPVIYPEVPCRQAVRRARFGKFGHTNARTGRARAFCRTGSDCGHISLSLSRTGFPEKSTPQRDLIHNLVGPAHPIPCLDDFSERISVQPSQRVLCGAPASTVRFGPQT